MICFVWPACVNWHKDVLSGVHQGMGGQHGYFGLWLDSDFGRGHSRARPKCTTYGSPQLSGDEDFTLDSMEVWAVGKPPEPEEVRVLVQILLQTLQNKDPCWPRVRRFTLGVSRCTWSQQCVAVWTQTAKQHLRQTLSLKPKKYMFAFCVIWALTKVSL